MANFLKSVLLLLAIGIPVSQAHHSVVGQYAPLSTFSITGSVERIDWVNPHAIIHIRDEATNIVYQYELKGLRSLANRGWTGAELSLGTKVEAIQANPSLEEESTLACCANIYDLQGYEYFTGSSLATDKENGVVRKGRNRAVRQQRLILQ